MLKTRSLRFLGAVALLSCLAIANPVQAASQKTRKRPAKAIQQAAVVQVPEGPLKPLTLEETPAIPPQVSYSNGQLTVVAQNSTLSDILNAVHQQTGAIIEMPGNASERVVMHLGPGPAREVLAALLNGSHFDYVMVGTAENPASVAHVILTAKSAGANAASPVQQAQSQPTPPPQPEDVAADFAGDDWGSDEEPAADMQADQQNQTDDQQQGQATPGQQFGGPLPNGQQLPNGQVMRSPEQLLQELQQRQMQMQQQQQNGGQPPTPAAPQGYPIPPDQQAQPPQ